MLEIGKSLKLSQETLTNGTNSVLQNFKLDTSYYKRVIRKSNKMKQL